MFQLITADHKKAIKSTAELIGSTFTVELVKDLQKLIKQIHNDIPQKKRISYGRYSIIKQLGFELYPLLEEKSIDVYKVAIKIFQDLHNDQFVRSLAVQLISIYGFETKDLKKVLPLFEKAAVDNNWEVRECSAGFIGKLTKKYPREAKNWYLSKVKSKSPLLRRFVSESLRPVADNRWLVKDPGFAFSIIENLYTESEPYPRTSVGNNLSDWARHDSQMAYRIVKKLVNSGNKDSCWIAHRACRNLVKKDPVKVMDLLKVDEYKYKDRKYFRRDYK
jgi:3-methyladenine DNA glycosylase AlkC